MQKISFFLDRYGEEEVIIWDKRRCLFNSVVKFLKFYIIIFYFIIQEFFLNIGHLLKTNINV